MYRQFPVINIYLYIYFRWAARFRTTYQAMRVSALMAQNGGATANDMAAYSKAYPEAAMRVRDLGTLGRVTMASGLAGFVGSTVAIWRWSKTVPLVFAGGLIAPFTFALVAEDVRIYQYPEIYVLYICIY